MKQLEQSILLRIWSQVVSELALHQDHAPEEFLGGVVNPICKTTYVLDTACAVKVFFVEYQRTQSKEWLKRARLALESIPMQDLFSGLHEPVWDVLGWHEAPGSLAATGIAIDALWDAMGLSGMGIIKPCTAKGVGSFCLADGKAKSERRSIGEAGLNKEGNYESLLTFLAGCFHGKGKFAHNTIRPGEHPSDVQNTNAIAVYLLEHTVLNVPQLKHPLFKERRRTIRHLYSGQKRDGFWPYCYPGWRGKLTDFGDTMHQVMTLYFVAKYFLLSQEYEHIEIISRGWEWIKKHLINNNERGMAIDWSWEPVLVHPRYCNFRDTNTYFWILALLPILKNLGIIKEDESAKIVNGLLLHISDNLLEEEGKFPCIIPHEGPPEVLRNIFPMFDQGVAWKGNFLAEIIRGEDYRRRERYK